MSAYNPLQPWNSVTKASSSTHEFWHKEFEKAALLYKMNGPKPVRAALDPPRSGGFTPGAGERRQHDPGRRDGCFFKSLGGVNICYDWTRNESGCTKEGACQKQMAHVCEWCRTAPYIVPRYLVGLQKRVKEKLEDVVERAEAAPRGRSTCEARRPALLRLCRQPPNQWRTGWQSSGTSWAS